MTMLLAHGARYNRALLNSSIFLIPAGGNNWSCLCTPVHYLSREDIEDQPTRMFLVIRFTHGLIQRAVLHKPLGLSSLHNDAISVIAWCKHMLSSPFAHFSRPIRVGLKFLCDAASLPHPPCGRTIQTPLPNAVVRSFDTGSLF